MKSYSIKSRLRITRALVGPVLSVLLFALSPALYAAETYMTVDTFLNRFLGNDGAGSQEKASANGQLLWLDKQQREHAKKITGQDPGFRKRYWQEQDQTAWVMDFVGRDHPITFGVVVQQDRIKKLQVLVYRESRGWEIRHDFFTRQFEGATLTGGRLSQSVDNITGATLSVNASKRAARLALLLHQQVMKAAPDS